MPPARGFAPREEDVSGGRGGVTRPWDRPGGMGLARRTSNKKKRLLDDEHDPAALATTRCNSSNDDEGGLAGVPFVAVDGVTYYSDRFYLASSEYDHVHPPLERGDADPPKKPMTGHAEDACPHCGSNKSNRNDESMMRQTPSDRRSDLLDVARLVASLELKAAVLATFSLDTAWFLHHFPSLAQEVPTMVLHGQRGSTTNATMNDKKKDDADDGVENGVDPRGGIRGTADDDGGGDDDAVSVDSMDSEELYTQPEETLAYVRALMANGGGEADGDGTTGESSRQGVAVSPTLYFTKVITKWVPAATGVGKHQGEFKAGVHHPKFLLLFEKSGSLVVVVTTANLTPRRTIDGVWVQRFPPSAKGKGSAVVSGFDDSTTADVGQVLQNLLTAQTHAIQIHAKDRDEIPMTPHAFVRSHLAWDGLDAISTAFDYTKAQAHLVATVPGSFRTPDFGRQRVSHILKQLSSCSSDLSYQQQGGAGIRRPSVAPWLPPKLLTDNDRLVIQPTSFGEWTEAGMARVVQSYLGRSDGMCTSTALDRLDIVWPTEKFIQSVRSNLKSLKSIMATALPLQDSAPNQQAVRHRHVPRPPIEKLPGSTLSNPPILAFPTEGRVRPDPSAGPVSGTLRPSGLPHERRTRGGYMFLSSSTFNRIDAACLSRMVQWEPCHPVPLSQRPSLVSHLKTIARVVGPAPEGVASKGQRPWYQARGCEVNNVFSWVMMTSACLSRGAQGDSFDRVTTNSKGDETVSYANFELGVLFCSCVQHKPTDRVYCWNERKCTCKANAKSTETSRYALYRRTTGAEGPRMIPLPFPYRLDAAKYQQSEDELEFAETPYFHEIIPSDCHVGNMRMTPFGEYVANKLGDE